MSISERVKFTTATTGTGTLTVGSGVRDATIGDGLTPAEAGVATGTLLSYVLVNGNNVAWGRGTYTSSGTTLSRDTFEKSWNGTALSTAKLSLTGTTTVFVAPLAVDFTTQAFPDFASGTWLDPIPNATSGNGNSMASTLRMVPFWVPRRRIITDLGVYIITASASGNVMTAIYANSSVTVVDKPTGNPLASVTGLSTTTNNVGVSATLSSALTMEQGWYWCATMADNSTARCQTYSGKIMPSVRGSTSIANVAFATAHLAFNNTYGTFPDLTSASLSENPNNFTPVAFQKVQ